jgi:hypothetical protein
MRFKGRIVGAFMLQCEQKHNQDTMRDHHNLPQGQGEINPRTCPPPTLRNTPLNGAIHARQNGHLSAPYPWGSEF